MMTRQHRERHGRCRRRKDVLIIIVAGVVMTVTGCRTTGAGRHGVAVMVDASDSSSPSAHSSLSRPSFRLIPSHPNQRRQREEEASSKPRMPSSSDHPKSVRVLRSWMIRHNSCGLQQRRLQDCSDGNHDEKLKKAAADAKSGIVGMKLTWKRPTLEQVSRWYKHRRVGGGVNGNTNVPSIEDSNIRHALRAMLQSPFNHDCVRMTNPALNAFTSSSSASSKSSSDDVMLASSASASTTTMPGAMSTSTKSRTADLHMNGNGDVSSVWWPSLDLIPNQHKRLGGEGESKTIQTNHKKKFLNAFGNKHRGLLSRNDGSGKKEEWRVLKHRSCNIGTGRHCYEQVRDAALDLSFASLSSSTASDDASNDEMSQQKSSSRKSAEAGDVGMMQVPDDQYVSSSSFGGFQ